MISVLLSLTCAVGLCAVLKSLDQKPLDANWLQKAGAQPNTLAAVLMTIAKASMLLSIAECIGQLKWTYFQEKTRSLNNLDLFSNASRGPWGALQLSFGLEYRGKGA